MSGETLTSHDELLAKQPVEDMHDFTRMDDDGGFISIKAEHAPARSQLSHALDPDLVELKTKVDEQS